MEAFDYRPAMRLERPVVHLPVNEGVHDRTVLASFADGGENLVAVLKAIAHPLRLRIVALLRDGEQHVSALAERLGAPPAIVSQQLRILRAQRLVSATRAGGYARYRLHDRALRDLVRFAAGYSSAAER